MKTAQRLSDKLENYQCTKKFIKIRFSISKNRSPNNTQIKKEISLLQTLGHQIATHIMTTPPREHQHTWVNKAHSQLTTSSPHIRSNLINNVNHSTVYQTTKMNWYTWKSTPSVCRIVWNPTATQAEDIPMNHLDALLLARLLHSITTVKLKINN